MNCTEVKIIIDGYCEEDKPLPYRKTIAEILAETQQNSMKNRREDYEKLSEEMRNAATILNCFSESLLEINRNNSVNPAVRTYNKRRFRI